MLLDLVDNEIESALSLLAAMSKDVFVLVLGSWKNSITVLPLRVGVFLIDLVEISLFSIILISVLIAIEAPIIALILSIFSDNKVEGVALLKSLNFVFLLLPVAALFIPGKWQYIAGIIPTYWPVKAFIEVSSGSTDVLGLILAGVVVHLIYLGGLVKKFGSKDF